MPEVVLFHFVLNSSLQHKQAAAPWKDTKAANSLILGHPGGAGHLGSQVQAFTSGRAKDSKPLRTLVNSLLQGS